MYVALRKLKAMRLIGYAVQNRTKAAGESIVDFNNTMDMMRRVVQCLDAMKCLIKNPPSKKIGNLSALC